MTDTMEVDKPVSFTDLVLTSADKVPSAKSVEGYVIIVTGLHEETTEDEVLDKFEDYGKVTNIHMNIDKQTGYVKGYALLEYANAFDAHSAIKAVEAGEVEISGNSIEADFAFVELSKARSRGDRNALSLESVRNGNGRDLSPSRRRTRS